MVICLERGADLHTAPLMPLPLTVSCFSKIQIGFTFLVPAHPGSPGQRDVKQVCVFFYQQKLLVNFYKKRADHKADTKQQKAAFSNKSCAHNTHFSLLNQFTLSN